MNKAITDGLVLMPPAFANGLGQWSSEDGTVGSATYAGAPNAAIVAADADFGGCLEIVKQASVTKLRYMGETPLLPGMYLRITARIKAVSGNLPSVRIAGWAGASGQTHVSGLVETGETVALTSYGEVVEVSAIVGSGARSGVDMPWGLSSIYGHFGLDLTGSNGGTVRIDDIRIEDVSGFFLADSSGVIDVRDFGAVGDGTTDCLAAFNAADAAANGRKIIVPTGSYRIAGNLTLVHEPVFQGTLVMADGDRLALRRGFDLNSYIDAFGDEELALRKAFQALLNYTDHEALDLCGRRIEITSPIDVAAAVGNQSSFEIRRLIHNGQINVQASSAWDSDVVTSAGAYSVANPRQLTNVANVANVAVGSLVTGQGVGREVYVEAVNVGAQTVTLSQPLFAAPGSQTYTFTRFKYALDFSGFSKLSQIEISHVEFLLNGRASGILLAPAGNNFSVKNCHFKSPLNRGITSHGGGCQDLHIDNCSFVSNEQDVRAENRQSIAFNVNGNDTKIRDSRFQRFGHTAICFGNGHLFTGNHWFQGDGDTDSPRLAGLVFTYPNVKSVVTGNYIDNSFIEMTNEHDAQPDFSNEYSFGGLTITGNIFTVNDSADWFSFIVVKPYGPGHFIQGLSVQGNTFKSLNGFIERIDRVDTTYADLDYGRMRNVVFAGNTYNGVTDKSYNPVSLEFSQNTEATTWVLDFSEYLPFKGWARCVESVVPVGALTSVAGQGVYETPYATLAYGAESNSAAITFKTACKGTVQVVARVDRPV
ncbi:right-handed parallel beta-helix repeat-containing protein [Celeribacter arenosi]|uniref:Glycosyl hydrolase family 28-related protein n=1 Tax=Celeribacter arenosi TaxID=792649 RepID=A0ABP7K886_9RHOB